MWSWDLPCAAQGNLSGQAYDARTGTAASLTVWGPCQEGQGVDQQEGVERVRYL